MFSASEAQGACCTALATSVVPAARRPAGTRASWYTSLPVAVAAALVACGGEGRGQVNLRGGGWDGSMDDAFASGGQQQASDAAEGTDTLADALVPPPPPRTSLVQDLRIGTWTVSRWSPRITGAAVTQKRLVLLADGSVVASALPARATPLALTAHLAPSGVGAQIHGYGEHVLFFGSDTRFHLLSDAGEWSERQGPGGRIVFARAWPSLGLFLQAGEKHFLGNATGTWTEIVVPGASSLRDLESSGSRQVLLGGSGNALVSGDQGLSWSPVETRAMGNFAAGSVFGEKFIAVTDRGQILMSDSGAAWRSVFERQNALFSDAVATSDGILVVGAERNSRGTEEGLIAISDEGDPGSWKTLIDSRTDRFVAALSMNSSWFAVSGNTILSSVDRRRFVRELEQQTFDYTDVTFFNGTFLASGTVGVLSASSDGLTWTRLTLPPTSPSEPTSGGQAESEDLLDIDVKPADGGEPAVAVVVGTRGLLTSSDGRIWTRPLQESPPNASTPREIHAIASDARGWLAFGKDASGYTRVFRSSDLTTWENLGAPPDTGKGVWSLTTTGTGFAAALARERSGGSVFFSADGKAWLPVASNQASLRSRMTSFGGRLFGSFSLRGLSRFEFDTSTKKWEAAPEAVYDEAGAVYALLTAGTGDGAVLVALGSGGLYRVPKESATLKLLAPAPDLLSTEMAAAFGAERLVFVGKNGLILTHEFKP